jgi:multidrug efflux pump subunit AcrB
MGGIVGRLFREFAVVLSTAILVSLVISLTTTPMMCARLLRSGSAKATAGQQGKQRGRFGQVSENVFGWVADCYKRSLQIVLRHPAITLGVLVATIAATLWLFVLVPKGFFPEQDNGTIFGGMQGPQDSSFQAMQAAALRVSETIKNDPAVAAVVSFVGGSGPGTAATNSGFVYVALKPLEERKISSSQVINRLRPKLAAVPGAMTFLQAGQDLRIGGRQSNAQYQYTIQSENLSDLVKWGPIMLAEMRKLHGFTDVNSDQLNAGLQAWLTYDRATAARLGISAQLIDDTLYDAFGQRQVSTMFTSLNQYHVVMEVDPQFWQNPKGLDMIYVRPTHGATVSSPGSLATSSLASSQPTPVPTPLSSQVASASTTSGTSASTISTSQLVPAPVAPTPPPVASPQPTDGPIAVPTPAFPFAISQANSTPNAVASIATATPSTTLASSLPTASSVAVATPAGTLATLQLIPTTPFFTAATAVASSTPASNATASPSSGGASSSPTPSPTPVVPLSAVASFQPTTAPIAVNHQGQFPSVTISFNLAGGMALSDAVTAIQRMQQQIGLPGAIHGNFSGTAQAFQASLASEPFLILAALVAVYLVLGILYESYIHPITILSTLPSAGVGALLALMLFRTDLSVIAMIGLLLLIGIVKKNAILMVDFALEAERAQGMRPREAIYQACLLRFRPILMTTVAALFGALPLVLSTGVGSELRRPLGITIVGGLIFSQALTLYTTPVVYLYFDRLREWWASRRAAIVPPQAAFGLSDAT